ncbi:DJ-1/PfpI family protein [Halostreptopolyspora alba]|uniref:Glutamine amidotransferase n=1 Tax=Halostreptopolyspora alba TaxID=2487137 RepID=A0A3N0EGQ6_9ACTN|nr:glutamine amidotransferase [Nocardiopsaceae bacterium YIM 96095]
MREIVHVAVYDTLADWEVGHAIAHIRTGEWQRAPGRFDVATVGETRDSVLTLGGVRITPDLSLAELRPADSAMLILPGAQGWDADPERLASFARTARAFLDAGVPVAAICGATAGLAREGLLDDREHTSAVAGYLAATGYEGTERYRDVPAVTDGDLVTAGPTAPVAFAREILGRLDVAEPEVLDAWYALFAESDPSAFEVLAAAEERR